MTGSAGFFFVLLAVVLLVSPLLAISAFLRVRKVQAADAQIPGLLQRIFALETQLAALAQHVVALEQQLAGRPAPPSAPPAVAVTPSAPTIVPAAATHTPVPQPGSVFAPPPLHAAPDKPSSALDLETLIAGRWLNRIGILALLLAVSFFLKYAFDNNWIGPAGRVAIGILLGSAMLPWSHWLLGRGYAYFSEGIAGLGEAVLYVSIWAGWHYYALFSQTTAFAAMIVVTALMAAVALGRNSQRIALLSLLGGFLTPALVSTGRNEQVVLFTYLLILGAGLLLVAARRDWRSLMPVSFALTQIYFWGWYERFYAPQALERTVAFAALFFLLYAAGPVLRSMRVGQLLSLDALLVLANAGMFLLALHTTLWPAYRWALTVAVLLLSAGHLLLAQRFSPSTKTESPAARLLFAGLALTFATLAIPIRLDGKWITFAWAVEGAVLVWSGFRAVSPRLRQAGYFLLAVAAFRLVALPIPAPQFLLNARFATYLVVVACLAASLVAARDSWDTLGSGEKEWFGLLAVASNVFSLMALSLEFWDYFGRGSMPRIERELAQHLSLSILWIIYATALILVGVKRQSALLRWQALALFGLAVGKVFLYDLSYLQRFYRIVSFLILGLVLLVVSFQYQRKLTRK
jgi:uncharacterized membrane protein